MENKRVKKNLVDQQTELEDRISDLPDSIIHHILSLLPSTKEAIRTTILSKRWENQWTQVPLLIFDSTGMSYENFLNFIDNALIHHDCPKINKFQLKYSYPDKKDPQFASKIHFAMRKDVEDLNLSSINQQYTLPKFLFNNASLVQLRTVNCNFMVNRKVNWGCLTTLIIETCKLTDQAVKHIIHGSPLLRSLELCYCAYESKLMVVASKSLKTLILKELRSNFEIEISCPMLETLKLLGCLNVRAAKLLNFPSQLCATLDFNHNEEMMYDQGRKNEIRKSLIKNILQQLRHVQELKIGFWPIRILSKFDPMEGLITPLNIKCLNLHSLYMNKYYSGMAYVLRNSPVLEKLVFQVPSYDQHSYNYDPSKLIDFEENYWNLNVDIFNCLVSHLKIIEIIGSFPRRDDTRKVLLNFVQFLLKNARVLEKMTVLLKDQYYGTSFPFKVSQELFELPRCLPNAVIKLLYP